MQFFVRPLLLVRKGAIASTKEPRDNKLPDSDVNSGMDLIVPIPVEFVPFDDPL